MTPIISIIIPFYNVEQYIAQCLDSVYNQGIPETEYEVICVNDGSPDNSREIVLEYQKKHSNLKLIEHSENKKLGSARNTGRSVAKGKYIWNVDSDDYIMPNVLPQIIQICEAHNLDVLIFNLRHLIGNSQSKNISYPFKDSEVMSGTSFWNKYGIDNMKEISPVWTQLYRREYLDKNQIYSPPINMGEDVPYTFKSLLLAERLKTITLECYVYRTNEKSICKEAAVKGERMFEMCIECAWYFSKTLALIPANETKIEQAFFQATKHIVSLIFDYVPNLEKSEFIIFRRLCISNISKVMSVSKYLTLRKKMLFALAILRFKKPIK